MSEMVGQVFETLEGSKCTITHYENCMKVKVKFLDSYSHSTEVEMSKLRKGSVKNPYARSVFGVGFVGFGRYKRLSLKGVSLEYRAWKDMLRRCYDKKFLEINKSYKGCSVHPYWHNFQNFADWYVNHESYGLGYHLDKDLLCTGNKIYSADTCSMLPREINNLLPKSNCLRGSYPIGVCLHKREEKYMTSISRFGKNCFLGYFDTPEEAFKVFKFAKEMYIKEVANLWVGKVSEEVFDALISLEVSHE